MDTRQIVSLLNSALQTDPCAVEALFSWRVSVNNTLAAHSLIPTAHEGGQGSLGILSLLNGIAALEGMKIWAHDDPVTGGLLGFSCNAIDRQACADDWNDQVKNRWIARDGP